MALVKIISAQVFSVSDPVKPAATIEATKLGRYHVFTFAGENTQDNVVDDWAAAEALAVTYADSVDNTDVTDKATRLELETKIRERDARIAELEALLGIKPSG